MWLRTTASYDLWTLDAANEFTPMIFSQDFRTAVFTLVGAGSANATVKFFGSWQEGSRPTLEDVASATNEYSSVQVVRLSDWTPIDWDTGVVYAWASDWVSRYEINENGNQWLGIKMTARAAWSVSIKVDLYDNQ